MFLCNAEVKNKYLYCLYCTIFSLSFRSLVDAVYALKDEVHELKKVHVLFDHCIECASYKHCVCIDSFACLSNIVLCPTL